MSERLTALAAEQHFWAWMANAACSRGGALLQRGETGEAISLIQQGLSLYRDIGMLPSYAAYLTYLAAAYHDAGRASDGLAIVDEGLSLCETVTARFHESDLLRLRGELLLLQGECSAAHAGLCQALEVARQQGTLSIELRCATSLSRLLRLQGERDTAQSLLEGVYGRFTEGFDTRDLREAKAFLLELT
jgi:tetratricopeptide (TPR) repeat protein